MIQLRDYQQEAVDSLFEWWGRHNRPDDVPIIWAPTASGKSIIAAAITERVFAQWPEHHPRTLMIVPSKELAEQNAEKLAAIMPDHISLGYYSAALGERQPDADVIVATIGSVYRKAHVLGNIKLVIIDEAHLVSPNGGGMYRTLLKDLAKYCTFRTVGLTATPFRGNGVWLTDGKAPLFTGISYEIKMSTLLERGYLTPLVRPADVLQTIDTAGIRTSAGDYNVKQLSERVNEYLAGIVEQSVSLAADRKKWIAFTPDVATAHKLAELFNAVNIPAAVVTGDTHADERAGIINTFKDTGRIRCLVSVLALTTGFDVPSIDCVIWARPTRSPVLYIQGAGRGMRIAPGKTDCLWLDFSDTTERLGPVDSIRGRSLSGRTGLSEAPFAVCDACGAQVRPASLMRCPECGHLMREEEDPKARDVSDAPVMASQIRQKINTYDVTSVTYAKHNKPGRPPSMRVEYWSGLQVVAREFICFEHKGYAQLKAYNWWAARAPGTPKTVDEALEWIDMGCPIKEPAQITVNETGKYPEIISYDNFNE